MASRSLRPTGPALPALALCAALSAGLACLVPLGPALALDDFTALDPANGRETVASSRCAPFGDACEHVSDRR